MLELGLVAALGLLGSFGHCMGMCGPIAVAFSLTTQANAQVGAQAESDGEQLDTAPFSWRTVMFHLLLNLGRVISYALVGAAIGGLGSVLVAGGQMAGVGSLLRRSIALVTGSLLILLGLRQVAPTLLPPLPLLHPLQGALHSKLSRAMTQAAQGQRWWTPALLGLAWGMVPCGFLYTAQIKAAETSSVLGGTATMLAFGLGTMPMMVGLGLSSAWLSRDRASQLFQLGGWITLLIGGLTLMRTGDQMGDLAGHLAILGLALALVARPLSKLWPQPLRFRRLLGVGACLLAGIHTLHMLDHSWGWQLAAVRFMVPQHQGAMVAGGMALALMMPLTLTSTDVAQRQLGRAWRSLHRLSVPALLLAGIHTLLAGSSYLGNLQGGGRAWLSTLVLGSFLLLVLAVRSPWVWRILGLDRWYAPPRTTAPQPAPCPEPGCSAHSPKP